VRPVLERAERFEDLIMPAARLTGEPLLL
jgi:hypothetical protein